MSMNETINELVLDGVIVRDPYRRITGAQALEALLTCTAALPRDNTGLLPCAPDVLVPLSLMRECTEQFLALKGRRGVEVEPGDDPDTFSCHLAQLDLIVVNFPVFTDGRGHSLARMLRDQYGYRGELRAVGDVFQDTVHYLSRCGFNAFVARPGVTPEQILQGFQTFSESYQAAVDCPAPLFRRRAAEEAGDAGKVHSLGFGA